MDSVIHLSNNWSNSIRPYGWGNRPSRLSNSSEFSTLRLGEYIFWPFRRSILKIPTGWNKLCLRLKALSLFIVALCNSLSRELLGIRLKKIITFGTQGSEHGAWYFELRMHLSNRRLNDVELMVQRRKPQNSLFKKQDAVWMIRHFTHQLFSYGFVAYKQSKSLNFVFWLFFDVSTRCKKLLEINIFPM